MFFYVLIGVFMIFYVCSLFSDESKYLFFFLFIIYVPFVFAKNFFSFLYPRVFCDFRMSVAGVSTFSRLFKFEPFFVEDSVG